MNSRRSSNAEKEHRLSIFGQRLQSLSDTFFSTIFDDSKEKKPLIKSAKYLEDFNCNDFTFDEYSRNDLISNDNFSFTFHSIEQTKSKNKSEKHQVRSNLVIPSSEAFFVVLDDNNGTNQSFVNSIFSSERKFS